MLSNNARLSFLIRKNSGRHKVNDYKQFFKGFNLKKLEYIDLEQSDGIMDQIRNTFSSIENESEMIKDDPKTDSALLKEISNTISHSDTCYIFTGDAEECGMFKASSNSILKSCLEIAFLAYNNNCLITDCEFKFSFTIDYNDDDDRDYPNTYEIHRKLKKD